MLINVGLITESQKTYVIDKCKLRRERQKFCEQISQDRAVFYEQVNGVMSMAVKIHLTTAWKVITSTSQHA